jgi:hypothetical protein
VRASECDEVIVFERPDGQKTERPDSREHERGDGRASRRPRCPWPES